MRGLFFEFLIQVAHLCAKYSYDMRTFGYY